MRLILSGRLRLGFVLLAVVVGIGTIGFMLIERWTPIQALYTTVLVVSTLGFSDLRPTGWHGQILTIGLIAAGVGTLYYFVGAMAQALIENQLDWGRRRSMEQRVAHLDDHFIVCGFGRVGQQTCRQLRQENCAFVVIDNEDHGIASIAGAGYLYVRGDA